MKKFIKQIEKNSENDLTLVVSLSGNVLEISKDTLTVEADTNSWKELEKRFTVVKGEKKKTTEDKIVKPVTKDTVKQKPSVKPINAVKDTKVEIETEKSEDTVVTSIAEKDLTTDSKDNVETKSKESTKTGAKKEEK